MALGFLIGCGSKPAILIPDTPTVSSPAASYAGYNSNTGYLSLGNGIVDYRWNTNDAGPAQYLHKPTGHVENAQREFELQIGDVTLSPVNGTLAYRDYSLDTFPGGGRRLTLRFAYGQPTPQIEVDVEHATAPSVSGFRKQLRIRNLTGETFSVSNIRLHIVNTSGMTFLGSDGQPIQQTDTPGIWLSARASDGCVVTWLQETPGVLKRWSREMDDLSLGLPEQGTSWATRLRLLPHAELELPAVHLLYQSGGDPQSISDTIHQYAEIFLPYAALSRQIAQACFMIPGDASGEEIPDPPMDTDLIIMEYHWQTDDEVLDNIRRMASITHGIGLRFGLQIQLTQFPDASMVNPAWQYQRGANQPWTAIYLGEETPVYCLGSDYGLFIGTSLKDLVAQYHLDALVLTGPLLASDGAEPYGCTAFNHDHYGVMESAWSIYQQLALVTQYLHHEHSELLLVTTSELWGTPYLDESVFSLFDQLLGTPPKEAHWPHLFLKQYPD